MGRLSYSSSSAAINQKKSLGFVQPLLPNFLNSFSIPNSFEKHLEVDLKGHCLQTVILMTESQPHLHWVITVKDSRFFSHGWEDFCLHYHLRVGDFLVFTYSSNLLFYVTVFDPLSSCERVSNSSDHRLKPPTGSKRMRVELESAYKIDPTESDEQDRPGCVVRLTSYNLNKAVVYLPVGFVRAHGLQNRRCQVMIVDAKRRVWPVTMNYKKNDGQVYIKRGWKDFLAANRFQPGGFLSFKLLSGGTSLTFKCYSPKKFEIESYFARKATPKEAQVEVVAASSSEQDEDDFWYQSLE